MAVYVNNIVNNLTIGPAGRLPNYEPIFPYIKFKMNDYSFGFLL